MDDELKSIFESDSNTKKDFSSQEYNIHSSFAIEDLQIKSGSFVGVIGRVGSGKTSLLLCLMDELTKIRGEVKRNGTIAYISQEPFLLNDTIKNNIVFGQKWDRAKYDLSLRICELNADLAILPG